jgi:ribosome modulation factor
MKAYLLNGVVSFVQSQGSTQVELANDISSLIFKYYEWEKEFGDIEDEEQDYVPGNLRIFYKEDGSVYLYRATSKGEEIICEGECAEIISISYFDALQEFSNKNPTATIAEIKSHLKVLVLKDRCGEFHEGWQSFLSRQSKDNCPYINPDIEDEEKQEKEYEWLNGFDFANACN